MNLSLSQTKPCVFLDRDGVINVDTGYTYRLKDFKFIDGAGEAIARLNRLGFLVIVVTNQSGVARGYYTEQDVHRFHDKIARELQHYYAHIDAFYLCPYHPEGVIELYKKNHPDRKPNPGMIERACIEWSVNKTHSLLVGDRQSDVKAAENANIKGYLFEGGNLDVFIKKIIANVL